jgi:hypothetical protein
MTDKPAPQGAIEDRTLAGIKRVIRDVYPPDAAGDERMDDLIAQLRALDWPRSSETGGGDDARH